MALIEQTMTEKNLAAHQHNARQSHGAVTAEGKERARAANLRHGYYSQLRDQALVALGEDPEGLAALVEGARQQHRPTNPYQDRITVRLASLLWRMDRAERMQENLVAAHVREYEAKTQQAARQLREYYADVVDFLGSLQRAVARPDFSTPVACLERCQKLREDSPNPHMDRIFQLLHQLRRPRRFTEPPPPPLPDALSDPEWQGIVQEDKETEPSVPPPEIPVAQGAERDPRREQLRQLAAEELRLTTEASRSVLAAQAVPLSTGDRDVLILEKSQELEWLRREERACFREFSRLSNELRKLQKELAEQQAPEGEQPFPVQASGREKSGENMAEYAGASGYVQENTCDQKSAAKSEGAYACVEGIASDPESAATNNEGASGYEEATASHAESGVTINEGASGYVEENTSGREDAMVTKCPQVASWPEPEPMPSHDVSTELKPAPPAVPFTGRSPADARNGTKPVSQAEAA